MASNLHRQTDRQTDLSLNRSAAASLAGFLLFSIFIAVFAFAFPPYAYSAYSDKAVTLELESPSDITPEHIHYNSIQWAIQNQFLEVYQDRDTKEKYFLPEAGISQVELTHIMERLHFLLYGLSSPELKIEETVDTPSPVMVEAFLLALQRNIPQLTPDGLNEIATKVFGPEVIEADTEITRTRLAQLLFAVDGLLNPPAAARLMKAVPTTTAPTMADITFAAGNEDTLIALPAAKFKAAYKVDGKAATPYGIRIASLPESGTLYIVVGIKKTAITVDQLIKYADFGKLRLLPTQDFTGTTTFTFNGVRNIGTVKKPNLIDSLSAATATVTVKNVNDAPVVASGFSINFSVVTGQMLTFSLADFAAAATDVDGDALYPIIKSLPRNATLYLNGKSIRAGQKITRSQIDAGQFTLKPKTGFDGETNFLLAFNDGKLTSRNTANISVTVLSAENPPVGTPPTAPTMNTPTVGDGTVNLNWTDNADNETGYAVYRSTTSGGPYTKIATLPAGATSYQDSNLTNGMTYYYLVKAVNSAGSTGSEVSATPAATPPVETAPAAPTNINATAGDSSVTLNWTDNATNETGYEVYRSAATSDVGSFTKIATRPANTTSYQDTDLTNGINYTYRVNAVNNAGSSISDLVFAMPQTPDAPPPPPTWSTATIGINSVTLNWNDLAGNETKYKIWRSTVSGSGYIKIATLDPNSHTYQDTSVTGGTAYYYQVKAVNNTYSSSSLELSETPSAPAALEISGFVDGSRYNYDLSIGFAAGLTGTVSINGGTPVSILSGATLSNEASYIIHLTNGVASKDFTVFIDKTAPAVGGVVNNGKYSGSVTPTNQNNEANLQVELQKDNVVVLGYILGTAISGNGVYRLQVSDGLNATVDNFEINNTLPTISGVSEGQTYNSAVTPTFSRPCTATLDGNPYLTTFANAGAAINTGGHHIIIATDEFGNQNTATWYINHVPALSTDTFNGSEDSDFSFTPQILLDHFSDADGTPPEKVIFWFPADVQMLVNGNHRAAGQEVAYNDFGNLKFRPNANFYGNVTLSLKAYSDGLWSSTVDWVINYAGVNDAPTVEHTISNISASESGNLAIPTTNTIDLSTIFKDIDSTLTYTVTSNSNSAVASTAINGNNLTITDTGIGITTITVRATGGSQYVEASFTKEVIAQATTLGVVSTQPYVVNGPHTLYIPISGLSTSLLSAQQIKDMITIAYQTGGNNGATTGAMDKNNWTVDKANNRIADSYTMVNDWQNDSFVATKTGNAAGTMGFSLIGINN